MPVSRALRPAPPTTPAPQSRRTTMSDGGRGASTLAARTPSRMPGTRCSLRRAPASPRARAEQHAVPARQPAGLDQRQRSAEGGRPVAAHGHDLPVQSGITTMAPSRRPLRLRSWMRRCETSQRNNTPVEGAAPDHLREDRLDEDQAAHRRHPLAPAGPSPAPRCPRSRSRRRRRTGRLTGDMVSYSAASPRMRAGMSCDGAAADAGAHIPVSAWASAWKRMRSPCPEAARTAARQRPGAPAASDCGSGAAPNRIDQAGDGGMLLRTAGSEREHAFRAGEDADGRQRIAAHLEEVVLHRQAGSAQHVPPQHQQLAFDRPATRAAPGQARLERRGLGQCVLSTLAELPQQQRRQHRDRAGHHVVGQAQAQRAQPLRP